MRILGIETSCDDTGLAFYDSENGLLGHLLHSQVSCHQPYGGVVPELASRDHAQRITPLLKELMKVTGMEPRQIDGIAYTAGPGLIGALLVGAAFAESLGLAWGVPVMPIHHLEGHLLAPFLEAEQPNFPFTALLVSGGHTLLVSVEGVGQYTILGESVDDAVGEAFDKTAKLLGLGYPGGAALSKLAATGDAKQIKEAFPRPMTDRPGLDFSFSGLKTFTWQAWERTGKPEQDKANIAAAFEAAVVDTLLIKCRRALAITGHQQLVVSGGVSANQPLRTALTNLMASQHGKAFYARPEFCTDNGAMIAYAGFVRFKQGLSQQNKPDLNKINQKTNLSQQSRIRVKARWPLEALL